MTTAIKSLSHDKFLIPLKIVLAYAAWKVLYFFLSIHGSVLNVYWLQFCAWAGSLYARAGSALLGLLGTKAVAHSTLIYLVEDQKRVMVAEHCLAIPAMVIFIIAIFFFKGNWKHRLWFVPLGLLGIIAINLIRVTAVSLALANLSEFMFIVHHSFIYVGLTYGFIFLMITCWMKKNSAVQ